MKQFRTQLRSGLVLGACLALVLSCVAQAQGANKVMNQPDGLYALFDTSKGEILVSLEYQKTPLTVINFTGLAEGKLKNSAVADGKPFYDGLTFHRVIKDFMIQGGDPEGTGRGGSGYRFADEIDPSLKFDSPGVLAMANAGPGTNGSQFFITHVPTPWLDGKHTIFGHVVTGQDVVNAIEQGDKINKLTIIRKGADAEAFKNDQAAFDNANQKLSAAKDQAAASSRKADEDKIAKLLPNAKKTPDGIYYVIEQAGSGDKPKRGQGTTVNYTGKFLDGTVFDSSIPRKEPFTFSVGNGQVIPGWDSTVLDMQVGEKRNVIIPPELGYGAAGYPGAIPPNSYLFFEIELLAIKK